LQTELEAKEQIIAKMTALIDAGKASKDQAD
jgi:hypothetical protein